jgi:hypothetical protein
MKLRILAFIQIDLLVQDCAYLTKLVDRLARDQA